MCKTIRYQVLFTCFLVSILYMIPRELYAQSAVNEIEPLTITSYTLEDTQVGDVRSPQVNRVDLSSLLNRSIKHKQEVYWFRTYSKETWSYTRTELKNMPGMDSVTGSVDNLSQQLIDNSRSGESKMLNHKYDRR